MASVLKTLPRTVNTSLAKAVEYKYVEKIGDPGKPLPEDVRFINGEFIKSPHFADGFYLRETNGGGVMFSCDVDQPTLCSGIKDGNPIFGGLSDDDMVRGLAEYRAAGYTNADIASWIENGHYLKVTQGIKPKLPSAKVDASTVMDAWIDSATPEQRSEYAKLPKNPTVRTKWLREWYTSR